MVLAVLVGPLVVRAYCVGYVTAFRYESGIIGIDPVGAEERECGFGESFVAAGRACVPKEGRVGLGIKGV